VESQARNRSLSLPRSAFAGFRFPPDVIAVAVRWYLRFNLSYRDVEELLVERGVEVDHVTVYRWVQRFTPLLADAARFARHSPGDRWFVDETYVKVNGVWRYVYRAIDQDGHVIDVLVSARRDAATARRFFRRALEILKVKPSEVITDAAPIYPRRHRSAAARRVASRRAVRQQPGRSRSRPAQAPAQIDAGPANRHHSPDHHRRTRLRPEPPPRPL
jgi:transposase-like protein